MVINNFNLRRNQARNMGIIHLNQSMYKEQDVEKSFEPILNLLKPTGHVMHQQFTHSTIARSAHTVFMCFVFIGEQTATCATYIIN